MLTSLPYICLCAAGSLQLVLHQICVVGGGDEVMVEGLGHVLVHTLVSGVENHTLWLVQVHKEPIFGHHLPLFRCRSVNNP